jgi:toluene monooxygenase system ferredoxin subunit
VTADLRWVDVAAADDLWEGDVLGVDVGGAAVLLVSLAGGELRAYQGRCPHQEQPLAQGDVEDEVLTCSGHLWEFDLRSGEGLNPAGCRLAAYEVRRSEDRLLVGVPAGGLAHRRCTAAGAGIGSAAGEGAR